MFIIISFDSIRYFSIIFWITGLWPSSNDTILSPFCHKLAFCLHFVIILSYFTTRRRKIYSGDKLNQAIRKYYNGIKKVIALTELMNVFLNSVEASFQMIIDACEVSVPALYQLVKNLFFVVENRIFCIIVSTNRFKIAISTQNRIIYSEP